MSNDNQIRKRAQAAAMDAVKTAEGMHSIFNCLISPEFPESLKGVNLQIRCDLAEAFELFAAQGIANAKRDGAREEREAIIAKLNLLIDAVDGYQITYFDALCSLRDWLRGREEESEKQ